MQPNRLLARDLLGLDLATSVSLNRGGLSRLNAKSYV